jgi:hypothetical protein
MEGSHFFRRFLFANRQFNWYTAKKMDGSKESVNGNSQMINNPTVEHILELIEQMPEEDRLALETRLSQRLEAEWEKSIAENQRIARDQGITEESIDRAIHRRRYGE